MKKETLIQKKRRVLRKMASKEADKTLQEMKDKILLESLIPTENEVAGYAECETKLLEKTKFVEMLNPCARGFKMLEISPL